MKRKKVLFSLFAIVIAGSVFVLATSGISKQNKYTPWSEQDQQNKSGISGAVEYLKSIRNNQVTGELDPKWAIDAREQAEILQNQSNKALDLSWSTVGPDNLGGRTRAILIDKNNPDIMYAGAASGGLWKSTTAGTSWTAVNDFAADLAVSCIAQGADGAIYVGTGEGLAANGSEGAANGGTAFIGKGIYKSADGTTFTQIASTIPTTQNSTTAAWAYINKIACDPTNPNRIYASTNKGMKSTDDGGTTWIIPVKFSNGNDNTSSSSDVDVASDGTVLTSVGNKCYVSPNGNDATFVSQSVASVQGDLPAGGLSRIEFAIAPSNPNYMYASASKTDGSLHNIYRSTDKGDNWTIIGPGGSSLFQPLGTQGWYDNTIAVYPDNPDKIIVGGLDMWEWHNGGTWTQKSIWYLSPTSAYYLHADHHTYVFNPVNPDIIFIGTDGGIARSIDGGETFEPMNINYTTIQCYALAASSSGRIMTGTQDNGTLYFPRLGAFPKHASDIMGGDGGWATFSYINPEAFFATMYYAGTKRSPDKGANFYPSSFASTSNHFFSARMESGVVPSTSTYPAAFVTPLVNWESFNDVYSHDSIEFAPEKVENEKMGKGASGATHFSGVLEKNLQPDAQVVPGTFDVISGSLHVWDDGSGNLLGNVDPAGANTIDYVTGAWDIEFSQAPLSGGNILATYETWYKAGATIKIESNNRPATFWYTTPDDIASGETIMIQDIIQSKFFVGLNNAVWMTKQSLDFSNRPVWYKLCAITPVGIQSTQCMQLTKDGNYLFVGTSNGKLFRLSNLRAAQDSITADCGTTAIPNVNSIVGFSQLAINSNSQAITSIAIDPEDPNNMIVTLGNYGNTTYVYYSSNALDSIPTFTSKQGNLPKMPVYASLIPIFNSGTVLLGTEYGIYATDNITASSPQWTAENTGLANVPVYMLWQQINDFNNSNCYVSNFGTIYAATHGRGVFECTKYTSISDPDPGSSDGVYLPLSVNIYPNPVNDNTMLSYTLSKNSDVVISVYDLTGRLAKTVKLSNISKGAHTYKLDCSALKTGSYFLKLQSGTETASTKFIKMN